MDHIEQTLAEAIQGDTKAFRQLYDFSYETVYGECIKNLHNSLDAEDVTQETYIIIYRRLGDLKGPEKFLGWCRRIAHNASVDYIRKHQRKAGQDDYKPPVSDEDFTGMDQIAGEDTELSPEEQAEQKMVQELLQNAMNDITPQRATCLALYQQGNTYKEIGEMLSLPIGTVKSNVHYAKQGLRKKIEQIEKREHVRIHGFTLIPLANGGVQVQLTIPTDNSFIHAETGLKSSAMQEEIWQSVKRAINPHQALHMVWLKAGAIIIAAIVVIGGVTLAVHQTSKNNAQTATATTYNSATQKADSENGQPQKRQSTALVSNSSQNRQTDNQRQMSVPTGTTRVRENITTHQEVQTIAEETREYYTF